MTTMIAGETATFWFMRCAELEAENTELKRKLATHDLIAEMERKQPLKVSDRKIIEGQRLYIRILHDELSVLEEQANEKFDARTRGMEGP